eukprot:scaffold4374_cov165-Amphora_coffeaeformis.AAC.1
MGTISTPNGLDRFPRKLGGGGRGRRRHHHLPKRQSLAIGLGKNDIKFDPASHSIAYLMQQKLVSQEKDHQQLYRKGNHMAVDKLWKKEETRALSEDDEDCEKPFVDFATGDELCW